MPDPIAIVGVGETEYVRRGTKRIDELAIEASLLALADAGIFTPQRWTYERKQGLQKISW